MNRNNIWIHITLAVVLIAFAAVVGQIGRWRAALSQHSESKVEKIATKKRELTRKAPEILVRFKPGVTLDQVRGIAAANNDVLLDEIESVSGLTTIDDLDDADANAVAATYSAMSDVVLYAEPNFEIKISEIPLVDRNGKPFKLTDLSVPNDPMFSEQWALNNPASENGGMRADLDALAAWKRTTGSEEIVVAVLDSGVDYNHKDLVNNMWQRPASVKAYSDDELGTFADERGYDATNADGRSYSGKGQGVLMSDPMD
jgi:subtilisin family serine protease